MAKYKELCKYCKKKFVLITNYKQWPICIDCETKNWKKIDKKKYKFLNLSNELYEKSYFLRNVRGYYERFGKLSDKQIKSFKETVKKLK
tara:strand:+ start:291 stop:557 length:267 start_codon:yes stop_codon:yes gene_type:complete